ncbi:MAG: hypothetical protein V3R16_07100 [Nitrospirales bacterium]
MTVSIPLLLSGLWLALTAGAPITLSPASSAEAQVVADSAAFFPDTTGNRWEYAGQVIEGPVQAIKNKKETFLNVSSVTGAENVDGVDVVVFHDSNPGNHGPHDSYYRRDAAGIVYYGASPGTPLERQVTPYQVLVFPLSIPSSFQQFDRKGLDFGSDLDGDGVNDTTDLSARVFVTALEPVTVPAGTYEDALRVEARMTIVFHLSKSKEMVIGRDSMTAWFARGVGLVKYVEQQVLPDLRTGGGRVTETIEELLKAEIVPASASRGRSKASPKGVFTDDPRRHELKQIVLPTGFHPDP